MYALAFGVVLASSPAAAQQHRYKLVQVSTDVMERRIETFHQDNPGWEIASLTPLGARDLGNAVTIPVSILILARQPIDVGPPMDALVNRVPGSVRVVSSGAPSWAQGTGYAEEMARIIEAKLGPPAEVRNRRTTSIVIDVVLERTGTIAFVAPRANRTGEVVVNGILDAVRAAAPFAAFPESAPIAALTDRTFSFTVTP